jgi:hypothetical protein
VKYWQLIDVLTFEVLLRASINFVIPIFLKFLSRDRLKNKFVGGKGKLQNLTLTGKFGRSNNVTLMFRKLLEMLDFLLAVEHHPAVKTEDFSVGFQFNCL